LLEKKIGVEEQYISIPPGVVPLDVSPRKEALTFFGISDQGPVIGWFARVTGVKNPKLALDVARLIPQAQFILAGGGDLLEAMTKEAPSNVKVVGWTKAEDILGASDIVLLTSKNEGMPVALIEAQLAGKPVVATNVGSVSEVIANNETGLVLESDPFALASAINELILDSKKRLAMADFAKIRAKNLFSVDQMITSHVALYKSILR
jgi:glycosyltransferase involved in cell wall biosynthesis